MKNAKETPGEDEFVECRRAELERFLNRLGLHPVLRMDPDLREFLEHEGDLPRATSTQALSGAGVKRLFKGIGESVSKITAGYVEESDSWFETKAEEVSRLEEQLHRLHTSAETLAEYRRDVAGSMRELSRSCALLAASEENTALARAVSQLSETQEKLERVHLEQANSDFYLLAELFKDYLGLVVSTKDAFHTRIKLYRAWQEAQTQLAKKRENKAKLELAGKCDKVPAAEAEIREAAAACGDWRGGFPARIEDPKGRGGAARSDASSGFEEQPDGGLRSHAEKSRRDSAGLGDILA